MTLKELNEEQKEQLRIDILQRKIKNPSYSDLSNAKSFVTDEEIESEFLDTIFTEEDFWNS